MIDKKKLKYYEDIALSDQDIRNKLGGRTNIIMYPDLHKYRSIDQILGGENNAVILYESKPQYGHWTAILKPRGDLLEFFNSYGGYPDTSLSHIDKAFREESNQDFPYLSQLLIDSPYNLSYNEHKLQKHADDVLTCGRHVIFRIRNSHLPLSDYKRLLDELKKKYHTDYDGVVTIETV